MPSPLRTPRTATYTQHAALGLCRLWATGIIQPTRAMRTLRSTRGAGLGLRAVLTRFVVTDVVETLPQALLRRDPFHPTRLPLPPERHYRAQMVYLPAFGTGAWLLMSGSAYGVLRLVGHRPSFDRILNVSGMSMLIPMPPLWASDALMIATDTFRLPGPAITHTAVQLWETALLAVGLHEAIDLPWTPAMLAGFVMSTVYVYLGASFVR